MEVRTTINELKRAYQRALSRGDFDFIDQVIAPKFWGLKKVRRAFEKYIGKEESPNRINPNPLDTSDYYSMKPSEQANVEGRFMDEVLNGKRII